MSSSHSSSVSFETATLEFQNAWNDPSHTQFELPPVNVNKVLKDRYRVEPDKRLTRSMIWDMESKKAWDPLKYIPYVVSEARSWGRHTLQDGSERFCRSSLQLGWITSERGRILEDVIISNVKQCVFFLGRSQMTGEDGGELHASNYQPLFHVEHGVGGTASAVGLKRQKRVAGGDPKNKRPRYCAAGPRIQGRRTINSLPPGSRQIRGGKLTSRPGAF